MTEGPGRRDLYVLVADQDMRETMLKLLGRSKSLGIRPVTYTVERHLNRDPGCRTDALRYLHPRASKYRRALIVFDKEGCGRESATREEIQREVEQDLACAGWRQRSKVIVIDTGAGGMGVGGVEPHPRDPRLGRELPVAQGVPVGKGPLAERGGQASQSEGSDEGGIAGEGPARVVTPVWRLGRVGDAARLPAPGLQRTRTHPPELVSGGNVMTQPWRRWSTALP